MALGGYDTDRRHIAIQRECIAYLKIFE